VNQVFAHRVDAIAEVSRYGHSTSDERRIKWRGGASHATSSSGSIARQSIYLIARRGCLIRASSTAFGSKIGHTGTASVQPSSALARRPVAARGLLSDRLYDCGAEYSSQDSIHSNGRLAVVARFGVGYDTVDVEACTRAGIALVITPDGTRRPVAVSINTFNLALAGRLMVKDRLTREGAAGFTRRGEYMGLGLVGRTLGSIGSAIPGWNFSG
jgi:hypothetical protein